MNRILAFFAAALFCFPHLLNAQPADWEKFESSFGRPLRALRMDNEKFPNQRIEGKVSMPWNDDSAWCDLDIEYIQLTDNPGEGDVSQRVVVKRLPKGSSGQFGLQNFPLKQGEEISVRFLAKSPDNTPFSVRVSMGKSPWSTYFSQTIQPSAEWQEFALLIPGEFEDPSARFNFIFQQPGTVDLDHFRAERREAKQLQISEERKGNLLPNSAFPLGAAPPWVAHGFSKETAGEVTGPTGVPAVVLDVRKQPGFARFEQALRVAYRSIPGQKVTIRVSADLIEGEAEISLRTGVQNIWENPWSMTTQMTRGWRTYEHTVELPISPRGYYLAQIAFEGAGRVAIDRVQVTLNKNDFALTGPVELAMNSAAPFGLVVGEKDPFAFSLAAWGNLKAAKDIEITLSDIHGKTSKIGKYPMPNEAYAPVTAEFTPPPDLPKYGTFRLTAQAVNAKGEPVGLPAELLLHRVREPQFAGRMAPESGFGIHYYTSHLDDRGLDILKKLGFNWLRLFKTFSWKRVESTKGEFDFSQTDKDVELMQKHNFMALGILGDGAPNWAAKNRDPNFRGWACWVPRDVSEFASYTEKVFERYGDKVMHFEPWNEPYYPGFFTDRIENGQRIIGSPEEYLTIQRMVFEKARESGKNIQIGWNTNTMEEIPRHKELLKLGILDFADFICVHHYLGQPNPEPEIRKQIDSLRETIPGLNKPVWNSEGGCGPFTVFNFYRNVPPFQEDSQHLFWAEWFARYYLACFASGVEKFFVYLFSAPNFWMPDYSINNVDGRLGPNLTSISALAWQVDGKKFVKSLELPNGGLAHLFEGNGNTVACVLPKPGMQAKVPASAGIKAYDLFANELAPGSPLPDQLFYLQSTVGIEPLEAFLTKK